MYRKTDYSQVKIEMAFGVELNPGNRWVKLAGIMPWRKIEEQYARKFPCADGHEAKSSRLAFGALYIQARLAITDEETVNQIWENASMQYFCGFEEYTTEKPFDSSLMVHYRKRISKEMMKEISEEAFASEALKKIAAETDKKDDDDENPPKGTLLLDATCCPSDIHFPTDVGLLNHARELTEIIIDDLHKQLVRMGLVKIKPRTYRENARKAFLAHSRRRKSTYEQIRYAIQQQLQFVRRNLETITKQVETGAELTKLDRVLYEKLQTIAELYLHQQAMFDQKTNVCPERIVSIAQPHLRPIVRGKAGVPVEFGAKIATAQIGGFTFVIHMGYDNFSEAKYLEKSAEEYKRTFGFYPKVIIGDRAYGTNGNRKYCKSKGIRLSCLQRGHKSEEFKEAERKLLYEDSCVRNAIEGSYGVVKRKYALALVMTKLYDTTLTAISFGFFVANMERVLRSLVALFWRFLPPKLRELRFVAN